MRTLTRRLAAVAAGLTTMTGLMAASPAASAAESTSFIFKGNGYGSEVKVGTQLASRTASQSLGCTNKAGIERENHLAGANLAGGAIRLGAATTRIWTAKSGSVVSSYTRHHVASVRIGVLTIDGLTTTSRAFHDGRKFGASVSTNIGRISAAGLGQFPAPTPGNPVVIPGIARLAVGDTHKAITKKMAFVRGTGLSIALLGESVTAKVGHAQSTLESGVVEGYFGGRAYGVKASVLGGAVTSPATPFQPIPCPGTNGWLRKDVADVNIPGGLRVEGATAMVNGKQDDAGNLIEGNAVAEVAKVTLGSGSRALVIDGLKARSRVIRKNGKVTNNWTQVTTARISFAGRQYTLAELPTLEIPGVASIDTKVTAKPKPHIAKAVALRITLLPVNGVETVVDVAGTEMQVFKR